MLEDSGVSTEIRYVMTEIASTQEILTTFVKQPDYAATFRLCLVVNMKAQRHQQLDQILT